jgi:hypothetical protein
MTGWLLVCAWLLVPFLPWRRTARALLRARERRLDRRAPRPLPVRPLEQIAQDARRLSVWHRSHPRGQSFAKYEAHRRAYDDVLAEACRALDVEHLLSIIPPGPALDSERDRVERRLEAAGLELGLPL